jgi:hypothetical protein
MINEKQAHTLSIPVSGSGSLIGWFSRGLPAFTTATRTTRYSCQLVKPQLQC